MAKQKNGNVALCPECEGPVRLNGKVQIGQKLSCRQCGSTLMIIARKPLELDLADDHLPQDDRPKADRKKDRDAAPPSKIQMNATKERSQMSPLPHVLLADCPECSATLRFHKPLKEHQLVVCPECDETLEIVSLRPLELNWANEDPWEYADYENPRHHSQYRP